MRIGIDCRLWNESGVGRYIRNLVTEIGKIKTSHTFVLFALLKDQENLKFQISKLRYSEQFNLQIADIHWHSYAEQKNFPKIIDKQKLDLMHFTYFSVPVLYSGKFVITMHDMIPFSFSTGRASTLPLPLYYAKREIYKYVVKNALKKAARVIVPAEAVKLDILKNYPISRQKIIVIYEGVSLMHRSSEYKLTDDVTRLITQEYFLYVGNAYPHKNLERLLKGFSEFVKKYPNLKLVLCGKKDYFYERLIVEKTAKKLSSNLVYLEFPTDSELFYIYKNAKAFISASLIEGFALPAMEAAALEVPLLLSNIPVFHEIYKDVPIAYFDPKFPNVITQAFEIVQNSAHADLKNHIQLGKELVKTYSWEKMAHHTLKIYESSTSL